MAFSFCSGLELADLKEIEKLIGFKIPRGEEQEFHSREAASGLVDGVPASTVKKQREQDRQQRIIAYKESKKKSGSAKTSRSSKAKSRFAPKEPQRSEPKGAKPLSRSQPRSRRGRVVKVKQ
jgi:hypothetical protein